VGFVKNIVNKDFGSFLMMLIVDEYLKKNKKQLRKDIHE
jgi:hypothetical protein